MVDAPCVLSPRHSTHTRTDVNGSGPNVELGRVPTVTAVHTELRFVVSAAAIIRSSYARGIEQQDKALAAINPASGVEVNDLSRPAAQNEAGGISDTGIFGSWPVKRHAS